jgi:heterodisulfide reductase subunit A-like polyferredoxin
VLVLGGGIAGIQAALDVADSGHRAYLVEKSASLGGRMAQLNRTFPSLDCSMCVLGPKMMDAGRHPNIEVITGAELTSLRGEAGGFAATVNVQPRYVLPDACVGCGECEAVCPVSVPNDFDLGLQSRKAIDRPFAQAVPSAVSILKRGTPPCTAGCPLHQNAQGYVALIAQGKFREALDVILRDNPLPSICGRICTHPCTVHCNRSNVDEPVNVPALKRFVTDYVGDWTHPAPARERTEKVAVIGSGPAGLACAYELRRRGFRPTVFEAYSIPGGMLSVGIPAFRLPRETIAAEIERLKTMGIEIRTNTPVGKAVKFDELKRDYAAIFIGIGTHIERKLNVPGESLSGVWGGVEFLRKVNFGGAITIGRRVLVIGGGNSALDAARTALRCGAQEVQIVYRRTRAEMPADPREVDETEEEGVALNFLLAPKAIVGDPRKGVTGLECTRMKLGKPDASGRPAPEPIPDSEFVLPCDAIIVTIGQEPDLSSLGDKLGLETTKWKTFKVDSLTGETNVSGVFAGGDCVTGPDVVVNAMYAGKKGAISISRFLDKEDLRRGREEEGPFRSLYTVDTSGVLMQQQIPVPSIEHEARRATFREVHSGYTADLARAEAERCLQCGICCGCELCSSACKHDAIDHHMAGETRELNVGAVIVATGLDDYHPRVLEKYSYGKLKNVVTGLHFDRLLNPSGPSAGNLFRPSDNHVPHRIAWIACTESSDGEGWDSTSHLSCMNALMSAVLALRSEPEIERATIYCSEDSLLGRDAETLVRQARKDQRLVFVHVQPKAITEILETGELLVHTGVNGQSEPVTADLVVLSGGGVAASHSEQLAELLGIKRDSRGFLATGTGGQTRLDSSRAGVLVCGGAVGLQTIRHTAVEASAAAFVATRYLHEADRLPQPRIPLDIKVDSGPPRIGVFVCHCGADIAGVMDVKQLASEARRHPGVEYAGDELFSCVESSLKHIQKVIKEHRLNRVVVAGCTLRLYGPIFQAAVAEAGVHPHMFRMANIRDLSLSVHEEGAVGVHAKAMMKIRAAVSRAHSAVAVNASPKPFEQKVLIIGAGLAGVEVAANLAERNVPVILVEASGRPEALRRPGAVVLTSSQVTSIGGTAGDFEVVIETSSPGGSPLRQTVTFGTIILAGGSVPPGSLHFPLEADGSVPHVIHGLIPMETSVEGVYVCGTGEWASTREEVITEAAAVAGKVVLGMRREHSITEPTIDEYIHYATVMRELCRACDTCTEVCPYHAVHTRMAEGRRYADVSASLCQGCGTCATWCPTGAIRISHSEHDPIPAIIDDALEELVG